MSPLSHLDKVHDRRIDRVVELVTPASILEDLPLTDDQADVVLRGRSEIARILDHA
ncbi:MAG: 3-deoxy-7-phosphoheptulonate synthase, partial [Solirubrobacteraceae bacterium]|nr:3-deoxy-7-phosphoheptulonate synthase [Solirubrobacteraceae bacterium]